MGALEVLFDADDLNRVVEQQIRRMTSADVTPALERIGAVLAASSAERIDATKRAPDGSAWAPWSPAYARVTKSRSLLLGSGDLMRSIDFFVQGDDEVHLIAETPYAATHQFGRGNIPARPFLGISDDEIESVAEIFAEHMAEVFGRAA